MNETKKGKVLVTLSKKSSVIVTNEKNECFVVIKCIRGKLYLTKVTEEIEEIA